MTGRSVSMKDASLRSEISPCGRNRRAATEKKGGVVVGAAQPPRQPLSSNPIERLSSRTQRSGVRELHHKNNSCHW